MIEQVDLQLRRLEMFLKYFTISDILQIDQAIFFIINLYDTNKYELIKTFFRILHLKVCTL